MDKEHIVILVVGRTCAGKSTLIRKVCERTNATQLLSYATRAKRNEQDIDHTFVNVDFYNSEKAAGNIVAETEIAGNYYFCTKEQLYTATFYTVDPNGRKMLLSMDLPNIRFVTVYVKADDKTREYRALNVRKDDKTAFRKREFSESQQFREMLRDESYDYVITNKDLAKAYSTLRWISTVEGALETRQNDYDEVKK